MTTTPRIPDDWEPRPDHLPEDSRLCQHCGAQIVAGYECLDCWQRRKETMDGALDNQHAHGITDRQPQSVYRVCCVCARRASEWYSMPSRDEHGHAMTRHFCPACRERLSALATRAKAPAGDARLTDWPDDLTALSHTARLTTTAHDTHRLGWHASMALIHATKGTRNIYTGRESAGDWLAVNVPDVVLMRLRLADRERRDGNNGQAA